MKRNRRQQPPARAPKTGTRDVPQSALGRAHTSFIAALEQRPLIDYTVIRTVVLVLAALGVVMVMSSSMASSFAASSSVWSTALRQSLMVLAGLVLFWVSLMIPPERIRKLATPLFLFAVFLLVLVLLIGTGREEVGSQSWLMFGSLTMQPSEFARVAIAIWGAAVLSKKQPPASAPAWQSPTAQFLLGAGVCILLIAKQGDAGMTMSFAAIVIFVLWFAGFPLKAIGILCGLIGAAAVVLFLLGGFRSQRFHVYFEALFGNFSDTRGAAFQTHQGFLSLADGSLFGVGLGQSRAKWFYLPEARNDFIFAVIGEELGMWGGIMVIALFAALGYFGLRTAQRAQTSFQGLAAASLTAGVVSQAFINIGYVVGLVPVTGIQLPMLSAGGTSAVITLWSMGMLASIARHEPDAVSAMQNYGRPRFDRMLFVPEPKATAQLRATRAGRTRTHEQSRREQRYGVPVVHRVSPDDRAQRHSPRPTRNVEVTQRRPRPNQSERRRYR